MVIRTLLVANRGEIALRVMRTAKRLRMTTVAVHTDLDATAPHVRAADRAVRVPSYLDIDAVVRAAVDAGADAIHPGYGFLSERAAFVTAVEKAGITFVGPSAEVMEQMGRKDLAREVAEKAGVPVIPSFPLVESSAVDLDRARSTESSRDDQIAFPVLVKAAAGGGGKGMRVVRAEKDLDEAIAAAKREALSAFGDDTMLLEKYVEHGRHIEVQVLADTHGTAVHLFERDCSTQRRHQKVLEEAPGPTLGEDLRARITSAAVDLVRQVGYTNAGTVEFLLDADTGEFYFLEMNTRLQVEHPVTEAICGDIDLVEHMLRIAAGEPLSFSQSDVAIHGHAVEARVYAEDSFGGFLPQAGTATLVRWPGSRLGSTTNALGSSAERGVRVDQALETGQVVSTAYDPMLGKVIVHGPDRESARRALVQALDDTAILGLTTNVGFLRALVASDEFRDATIDTAWLDHAEVPAPGPETARVLAAWTQAMLTATQLSQPHPFQADGFRIGADPAPQLVELDVPVVVDRRQGTVTVDGTTTTVTELSAAYHVLEVLLDGRHERAVVNAQAHSVEVVHHGQRFVFTRPDVFADHGPAAGDGSIGAPMPGTVLEVRVMEGDEVAEGQVLGMMEAMKMELALKAPYAGIVTTVGAEQGDQVDLGAVLFEVEAAE